MFNLRDARELRALNSITKYPSIPTYHELDPTNGQLLDTVRCRFVDNEPVTVTEKIDGTNGRLIVLPTSMRQAFGVRYLIGSREELLYADGDVIHNPKLRIVEAITNALEVDDRSECRPYLTESNKLLTFFFEVFGSGIGRCWRQYTSGRECGLRLFDVAAVGAIELNHLHGMELEQIARLRDNGGFQDWLTERELTHYDGGARVPVIADLPGEQIPTGVQGTLDWMTDLFDKVSGGRSMVALDDGALNRPEGVVLRSPSREVIRKLRFEDYKRTLTRRAHQGK